MPLFKIDESSTLFSKLLGFDSYDSQNMLQLPPASELSVTGVWLACPDLGLQGLCD
jgi:hypothetical protein